MPGPAEASLPQDSPAGPSHSNSSTLPLETSTSEVITKFQQLGKDAEAEDADDDEEEEDEEGGDGSGGVGGEGKVNGDAGDAGEGKKKKKKKKKKSKAGKAIEKLRLIREIAGGEASNELVDTIRSNMDPSEQNATDEDIRKALKAVDLMKILDGQIAMGNKSNAKIIGEHKFWKTQPVPQLPSASSAPAAIEEGPIDPLKKPSEVRQQPLALPSGFEWSLIDIKNDEQCVEVYTLLSENYVEDDDAMFRFRYSKEFLLWSLTAPGYHPDWHIGVRVQKTGKLVAFISGILAHINVRSKTLPAAEINFLCVHKKLRSKRLTPVLIKEVTRRVNLENVWQAIYTAGIVLPTPIGTSRYYHRNLNPPKLVDIGFSPLSRSMTISRLVKQLAVPPLPQTIGFREMEKKDVTQVRELLTKYLSRFEIHQVFQDDEEVEHWFLSGRGKDGKGGIAGSEVGEGHGDWGREGQVVWSYVVEDPATSRITDVVSFFSLPSSIMKHKTHKVLNAAYMYYYASDVIFNNEHLPSGSTSNDDVNTLDRRVKMKLQERLNSLVGDIMIVAKNAGFDVLNALTLLDNNMFLGEQKFGPGDGYLNYYLYNWQCSSIDGGLQGLSQKQSAQIGVVML